MLLFDKSSYCLQPKKCSTSLELFRTGDGKDPSSRSHTPFNLLILGSGILRDMHLYANGIWPRKIKHRDLQCTPGRSCRSVANIDELFRGQGIVAWSGDVAFPKCLSFVHVWGPIRANPVSRNSSGQIGSKTRNALDTWPLVRALNVE